MENIKFELTFNEAMEAVFSGHAVQGENFLWNCYVTSENGIAKLNEFHENKYLPCRSCGYMPFTKGIQEQKYRIVHVINKAGLYHS